MLVQSCSGRGAAKKGLSWLQWPLCSLYGKILCNSVCTITSRRTGECVAGGEGVNGNRDENGGGENKISMGGQRVKLAGMRLLGSHALAGYGCRTFVTRDDSHSVCNAVPVHTA